MIVTDHICPKLAHFHRQFMEKCTERHVNSTNSLGHIHTVVVTLNQKILQGFAWVWRVHVYWWEVTQCLCEGFTAGSCSSENYSCGRS